MNEPTDMLVRPERTMNLSLYHLTDEYLQAIEHMAEAGMDQQTISDTLEGLEGPLVTKAQNVVAYCLNVEAEAEAIDAMADKLKSKANARRKITTSLREYLHSNMTRLAMTEIKANDGTFTAKIKNNPPKVEITDADSLPAIYLRTIPEKTEPDKAAISKALKAGEEIPGAVLVQNTRLELA